MWCVMWNQIKHRFERYPSRMDVARKIIELGLRIDPDGKVYCGDVEINDVALARAIGVDRRTVRATAETILEDEKLREIFQNLRPAGALLRDAANELDFGVVEIEAEARNPGILAAAAELISESGITIRQAHAGDPELDENPKLTIITEKPIPGSLLREFLKIDGVKRVSIY
ncbi:amino acid-binding protein [Methanothermobacter sp. K4]|nr:amino acid-binding protein [Methanothermobacter sp. K4]